MIEIVRWIEFHASHTCNLRCQSCSHFAPSSLGSPVVPEEAFRQMEPWGKRLSPARFNILGGEPTLNPRLSEILMIARRCWPDDSIHLVTNGFFLDRHPDLPSALLKTGARLIVTKHDDTPEYERRWRDIERVLNGFRAQKIDVKIGVSNRAWTLRYHGSGNAIRPFRDDDQRASWTNCVCRHCHQLHDGLLWKCPILAYLPALSRRWPEISDEWALGLAYRPLRPDASDDEVRVWFALEDEPQCSLCPAHPKRFSRPPVLSSDATEVPHDP
jgi:hypothetical protein